MSVAKVLICNGCGKTEPEPEQILSRAPGWWKVFGDGTPHWGGAYDFCSTQCLAGYFAPVVTTASGKVTISLDRDVDRDVNHMTLKIVRKREA